MTEITVIAEKHVSGIYVELPYVQPDIIVPSNVQGTIQVVLKTPDEMQNAVVETTQVRKPIDETSPEVQTAITTLINAVLQWEVEANTPPPPPEPE